MSVLIKGMEMPKDKPLRIVLNPNGQLFVDHSTWYTEYEAVEIPPHGRLIDADAIPWIEGKDEQDKTIYLLLKLQVEELPTVIESEGEE